MPKYDLNDLDIAQWKKEVGERLRVAIIRIYGKRQAYQFAKHIGISQGSLSDITNGVSSPSALTLLKIHQNSTINIIKLLKG